MVIKRLYPTPWSLFETPGTAYGWQSRECSMRQAVQVGLQWGTAPWPQVSGATSTAE